MFNAKKQKELECLEIFLDRMKFNEVCPIDQERESPDFIYEIEGRKIGLEITTLHNDETELGSKNREKESKRAKSQEIDLMYIEPTPYEAFNFRLNEKSQKAKKYLCANLYEELWLVIGSNIPVIGGIASTYALSRWIQEKDLDKHTADVLIETSFQRIYWLFILDQDKAAFLWSRDHPLWKKLYCS